MKGPRKLTRTVALLSALILISSVVSFAAERSPYVDMIDRGLKALGPEEVAGYTKGMGMGFAMAAELNNYPGPKHVLELAVELQLSHEQVRRTVNLFDRMETEAIAAGRALIERESRLDTLFAQRSITAPLLEELVLGLGELRGQVRLAHLRAHLSMMAILSQDQVDAYVRLRGYDHSGGHNSMEHHGRKHGH